MRGFHAHQLSLQVPGLLLLAGCATYEPRPLSTASLDAAFGARTLDRADLSNFLQQNAPELETGRPLAAWNVRLLTLAAYFYHGDIEAARAKLAAADAALMTAGARPNPSIGFSPTFDADAGGGISPWTLGFTLDLPIETAGKRSYRADRAQHAVNSARLHFASAAWLVRSRVRKSVVELEGAIAVQEIIARQLELQNQTVALLEARWKAGEASLVEVQLVRVAASQAMLDLDDARKQSAQARIRLADAVGVPAPIFADCKLSFAELDRLPAVDEAAAARRQALLNRTDILGALADYDASQSALQLEIAKQYPDVHLGPGYAWDQSHDKFTLGASLTLPVFDRNRGPIAEAEARRRQAAAALMALEARAANEVESACAGYGDALRKLATADSLLNRQRQRVTAMQESFAAGAVGRVELLQVQLELATTERARATAFSEAQFAHGALEDAVRRPVGAEGTSRVPESLLNGKPQSSL